MCVYVYMYVCMCLCVCMCVCMFVCLYVCTRESQMKTVEVYIITSVNI